MIGTGGVVLRNIRMSENHSNHSIVEIGQNTKSAGDLRRHAVTQTPVETIS